MKKLLVFVLISLFILSFSWPVFAQQVERVGKTEIDIEKEKELRERVEEGIKKPSEEEPTKEEEAALGPETKTLINSITVIGATLVSGEEIDNIIQEYQGQELSVREMQKVADLITDVYRRKGYVTSRAYLPPQKIEEGTLEIRIVEGITGDIEVKGNRYFKTKLYKKRIALKKGEPFDYEVLRKGMSKINQLPDRSAKAVLAPGKEAGTTDVVLEVQDRFPIHATFDFDNYGSPYIDYHRGRTTVTHNNLLGWDDTFNVQYQTSEGENYRLLTMRYLLPLTNSLKLGLFAADSKIDLRYEYEDENLNARGKSRIYTVYLAQDLINTETTSLVLNLGFDYKDTFNFQQGIMTSRDRMRVARLGFDWDKSDRWGRTIVTDEISYGIDNIMGGLQEVDPFASRSGSGGKFWKNNLNVIRLNRMPFNSTLLWKNRLQFTPYILTAAEQYQIGGIINVRAYPPAELVGDKGYSSVVELSFPPYLVPKDLRVPFSKAKIYDAVRIVTFYDWANVRLFRPGTGEEESETLRGAGCGLRLSLPENFSARIEVAWPLDKTPSDSDNVRTLFEVSKTF